MYGPYIHIPFCVRKCLYCDFYSIPLGQGPLSHRLLNRPPDQSEFLDALENELSLLPARFAPGTIFIGGGTPTELSDKNFDRLLEMVSRHADLSRVSEWTCESNPGTLTREKAMMMKEAGINRVSLGSQSFHARNLEFLGRIHSAEEGIEGYNLLRECGFRNINLDLIYGVPGSKRETHLQDVEKIIELDPEHTSFYSLTFEKGTPLTKLRNQGFIQEVHGEEQRTQFERIRNRLIQAGYRQYEISNYAKPAYECQHNVLYWSAGEYIGCGPSAHSHWQGIRYGNVAHLKKYCHALLQGISARDFEEQLDPEDKARETLVIGLRRLDGISRHRFHQQTGFYYRDLCGQKIDQFRKLGLMQETDRGIRLTDKGLFVSDAIFAELI